MTGDLIGVDVGLLVGAGALRSGQLAASNLMQIGLKMGDPGPPGNTEKNSQAVELVGIVP